MTDLEKLAEDCDEFFDRLYTEENVDLHRSLADAVRLLSRAVAEIKENDRRLDDLEARANGMSSPY